MAEGVRRRMAAIAIGNGFDSPAIRVDDESESPIDDMLESVVKEPDPMTHYQVFNCLRLEESSRFGMQKPLVKQRQLADGAATVARRPADRAAFFAVP